MQTFNFSLIPLYKALSIANDYGCLNSDMLLHGDGVFLPFETTQENFTKHYQEHLLHIFYCNRDDCCFNLEDTEAAIEAILELDENTTEAEIKVVMTKLKTIPEEHVYNILINALEDDVYESFRFTDPETQKQHYIIVALDI